MARTRLPVRRWGLLALLVVGCTPAVPVFGLRPLSPEAHPFPVRVESLQPTFQWESFPRSADRTVDREGRLSRAQNVGYDLRIWRTEPSSIFHVRMPAELVYSRIALPATSHTVETPLESDTVYVWSIRARFKLDGQTRVTEWSMLAPRSSTPSGATAPPGATAARWALEDPRSPNIPPLGYFLFKTP